MRRSIVLAAVAVVFLLSSRPAPLVADSPHGDHATANHSFAEVERWKSVFEDPGRDEWQKPSQVVRALGLKPGMSVADIGAGTGYFLPHLAAALAPHGVVYAVEPEPALLDHIRTRIGEEKLRGVVPVLASLADPHLPDERVDLALIVDTYHHIDARLAYLRTLRAYLKPLGRIAVIDWKEGELPVGPPPEHRVARDKVADEMRAAGFGLLESLDLLPYQYFLVFRKEEAATMGGLGN
jgi:predicted methyltransferase